MNLIRLFALGAAFAVCGYSAALESEILPNGGGSNRYFASGERFRLRVATEEEGYVYVVVHGSDGEIRVLAAGRVAAGDSRATPERYSYRLDRTPGVEDVYVVWSAAPVSLLAAGRSLSLDDLFMLKIAAQRPGLRQQRLRLIHVDPQL